MNGPLFYLVLTACWGVFLSLSVVAWRSALVLSGKVKANGFTPGVPHGTDLYWRINRASINCAESLPVFAILVIAAILKGEVGAWWEGATAIFFFARVAQSIFHISSGSSLAVVLRFAAYQVQLFTLIAMAIRMLAVLVA